MFSVILPVYNGGKFISSAIDSVPAQDCPNRELLVMNDGSTDNTAEVLKKYSADKRIHILTQKNMGVSAARNNAAAKAKGEYFAFIDADDIWHKNHLSVIQSLIDKYPSAGLYATFARTELASGGVVEECNYFRTRPPVVFAEDFFEEYCEDKSVNMFTTSSTCVSREAFYKTGGFPLGCPIGEDLESSLRIAAYYPVVLTKEATATYKKANSTATKDISFDPDRKFFDTVSELYADDTIPQKKRENLKKLMDWFTMRRCRHYIINGERKKAWQAFRDTNRRYVDKKDIFINIALLFLPTALVRRIFAIRWRGKA